MNIFVIAPSQIGDAVLSTGILNAYIEKFPGAKFTIACGPLLSPLFKHMPRLEKIIIVPQENKAKKWLKLWSSSMTQKWYLVLDFQKSAFSYLIPTQVRLMATKCEMTQPKLWTSAYEEKCADSILKGTRSFLAITPTANGSDKEWPLERFTEVAQKITRNEGPLPHAKIAVLGSAQDSGSARNLFNSLPQDQRIDLGGTADLLTIYAILKRANLFIGNDSELMQIAAASGCPTMGLFGPTDDYQDTLTVDQVVTMAQKLLKPQEKRQPRVDVKMVI